MLSLKIPKSPAQKVLSGGIQKFFPLKEIENVESFQVYSTVHNLIFIRHISEGWRYQK